MANRPPFEIGEWYHCFNRGVEKRKVFENEYDANRFIMLLYLANGTKPIGLFNTYKPRVEKSFLVERGQAIVSIGAFCLMPNHFHLLLKEHTVGGISSFLKKVGTAYAMYFNARNKRVGNVFLRPFRSRHIATDRYFQHVIQYIHLNPAELYEPGWKQGVVKNMRSLHEKLAQYPYSSLASYENKQPKHPVLSKEGFEIADQIPLSRMLADARSYYEEVRTDRFER
ncbi:transposase [Candidatus Kaiserbacteria bacterium]|nr:transposase [Candidatus Kaiserbacteria bacterium]